MQRPAFGDMSPVLREISTNDLMQVKALIEDEIEARSVKLVEGLASEINAKIRQILANGFMVRIETSTDEMAIGYDDRNDVAVTTVMLE